MMDRDYLGSWDLPDGRDAVVTIAKVQRGELKSNRGSDKRPVVYFAGAKKALVCNATNGKTLQRLFGPYVEDWVGKSIALYVSTTSSPDGEVPCIRIRPSVPRAGKSTSPAAPVQDEREPSGDDDKGDAPTPEELAAG